MDDSGLVLLLLDFAFIGALPRVFFKRGEFAARWWLTAMPLMFCPLYLVGAAVGLVPWLNPRIVPWVGFLKFPSVILSASSIALIAFTLGTHRVRIALWHQEPDAPEQLVTYGAYARIRHPFYTAFLLALLAALLLCPSLGTLATMVYGLLALNFTAAREERRLRASEFGQEYLAYMQRTGRFWPKLAGTHA